MPLPCPIPNCSSRAGRIGWPGLALALGAVATPALAGSIDLIAVRPLDFGSMVVIGNGQKRITPDGVVTADGLAAVPGAREGPAEFVLRYRPDRPNRSALLLVTLTTASPLSSNGSTGTLTRLESDLPGLGTPVLGQTRTIRLPPCSGLLCDTRFRIGGTLGLNGGARAASFSFPLQVTARLLAEL